MAMVVGGGGDHLGFMDPDRTGEEHHQQHHQEEAQGRDLRGPVAIQIEPGQATRTQGQVRQGLPDPAIEMKQALDRLHDQLDGRAMEVLPQLATSVAPRSLQRCPAIGARGPRWQVVIGLATPGQKSADRGTGSCFKVV